MKIITWNVNGLRAVERKEALGDFLKTHDPAVFFIQETKSKPEQVEFLDPLYPDYQKFYHSAEKPGYAGTGVWVKQPNNGSGGKSIKIVNVATGFPASYHYNDTEGRIIRVDIDLGEASYALLGVYFPNGGKSPEAWDDKLVFYDRFLEYVNEIRASGLECIWSGDVNCAHEAIDLARPKENDGVIGFHPRERAWVTKVIENKWVDIFRTLHPKTVIYSWWHLISRARSRNVGWRIDYFFCDTRFLDRVEKIEYLNDQQGSDHCPVLLEIK